MSGKKVSDTFQSFANVRGSIFKLHFARLNSAHFQNVIYQSKQMLARRINFSYKIVHFFGNAFGAMPSFFASFTVSPQIFAQFNVPDNRIHRRANVVAHIEEKSCFCVTAFFGSIFRRNKFLLLNMQSFLLQIYSVQTFFQIFCVFFASFSLTILNENINCHQNGNHNRRKNYTEQPRTIFYHILDGHIFVAVNNPFFVEFVKPSFLLHLNQYSVNFYSKHSVFGVHSQNSVNVRNGITRTKFRYIKFFKKIISDLNGTNCKFVFAAF